MKPEEKMKPRKKLLKTESLSQITPSFYVMASIFHSGNLSGESGDNTGGESNKSSDGNPQDNGDSEPRAIKFHSITDLSNEIMLILATKVAFVLFDVRSSRAAAVLFFTLIGGFQNLLKHNRFSISKDVVDFQFPRVHILRYFPE